VGLFASALCGKAENRLQLSLLSQIRVTLFATAYPICASSRRYIPSYRLETPGKLEKTRLVASTPFHATAIMGKMVVQADLRCGWSAGTLGF
jgi:hypothetical protein